MESLVKSAGSGVNPHLPAGLKSHHPAFTSSEEVLKGPESHTLQRSNTSKTQNHPPSAPAEDAIPLLIRRDSSQRISSLANSKENRLFKTLSLLKEKSFPKTSCCSNSEKPLESSGLSFESKLVQLEFKNMDEVYGNADEELRDAIDRGLSLPPRPKERVVPLDELEEQADHHIEDDNVIASQDSLSKQKTLDLSDMVTGVIRTKSTTPSLRSQDSLAERKTLDLNDMDAYMIMTKSTIPTVMQSEKPECTNSSVDGSDQDITANPPLQQKKSTGVLHPEREANEEDEPKNWSLITHKNKSEKSTTQVQKEDNDLDRENEAEMREPKNQSLLSDKNMSENSAQAQDNNTDLHEESEVDEVDEPKNLSSNGDMNMSKNFTAQSQKGNCIEVKSDQSALVEAKLKKMFSDSSPLHGNEDPDQESESRSQTPVALNNVTDNSCSQAQAISVTDKSNEPACLADTKLANESFKMRRASSSSPDYNDNELADVFKHTIALKSLSANSPQNAPTKCRSSDSPEEKGSKNEETMDIDDQMRSMDENDSDQMNEPKTPIQSKSDSVNARFNSTSTDDNIHDEEQLNVSENTTKSKGSFRNELGSELITSRSRSSNSEVCNNEEASDISDQVYILEKTEVDSRITPPVNEIQEEKQCKAEEILDNAGHLLEIRSSSPDGLDDERVKSRSVSLMCEVDGEKDPLQNIDQVTKFKKSDLNEPLSRITGSRRTLPIYQENEDEEPTETDNQMAESRNMFAAELNNGTDKLKTNSRSDPPANAGHDSNGAVDLVKHKNKSRNSPPHELSNAEAENPLPVNEDNHGEDPSDVMNQIDNEEVESEISSSVSESHSNNSIADVTSHKDESRNESDGTKVESVHVLPTSKELDSGEPMNTDDQIGGSGRVSTSELCIKISNSRSLSIDNKIANDDDIAEQAAEPGNSYQHKLENTSALPSKKVHENEKLGDDLNQITGYTSPSSAESDSAGTRSGNDKERASDNTNQMAEFKSSPKTCIEIVKSVGSPPEKDVHTKEADGSNDQITMPRNSSITKSGLPKSASLRSETHHISFSRRQSKVEISVNRNELEKDEENFCIMNKTSQPENQRGLTQLGEENQQNITAHVVQDEDITKMENGKNDVDDMDLSKSPATVETLNKIDGKIESSAPKKADQLKLLTEPSLSTVKQTDNCPSFLEVNNIDQECGFGNTSAQMDDHTLTNKSPSILPVQKIDCDGVSKIQSSMETLDQQETAEEPNSDEKKKSQPRLSRCTSSSTTIDLLENFGSLSPNSDPETKSKPRTMPSIERVASIDKTNRKSSVQVLNKKGASEELQPEGTSAITCPLKKSTAKLTVSQEKINLPSESGNQWTSSTSLSSVQQTTGVEKSKHQKQVKEICEKGSESELPLESDNHIDISQKPTSHQNHHAESHSPKHGNGEVKEIGRTKDINSLPSSDEMNEPSNIIVQTDQSITTTVVNMPHEKDHSRISSKRKNAKEGSYMNKKGKSENLVHITDVSQVDESDDFTADQIKISSAKQGEQTKLLSQATKQTDALKILSQVKKPRNQTYGTPTDLTEIVCNHSQTHDVRPIRCLRERKAKETKPYSRAIAKSTRKVEVSRVSARNSRAVAKGTRKVEVSRVSTRKHLNKETVTSKRSHAKSQRTPPTRHIPVTSTVPSKHGTKTNRTKPLVLVNETNILPPKAANQPTQRILRSAAKKVKFNRSVCSVDNSSPTIPSKECQVKFLRMRTLVTSGHQVTTSSSMKRKNTSLLDSAPPSKVSRKEHNITENTSVMTRRSARIEIGQIQGPSSSNITEKKVNIFAAVENGNLKLLEKLIQDTGPAIRNGKKHCSLLHTAVASDQCEIVRYLLKAIDPNIINKDGETPAHVAAREGRIKALNILLADKEINLDKRDHLQRTYKDMLATPLFDAVLNGNNKKVEALVKLGANPDYHAGDIATGIMARELRVTTARQLAYTLYGEKYLSVFAKEGKTNDKTDVLAKRRPTSEHRQTYQNNLASPATSLRSGHNADEVGTHPRGHVCILNFKSFIGRPELERDSSEGETQNLSKVFRKLGYSCETHSSLTAEESRNTLMKLRETEAFSDVRCAIIVISSHGMKKESFLTSDTQLMSTEFVMNLFRDSECPQLKGKPKLFIFDLNSGSHIHNLNIRLPRRPVRVQEPVQAALCLYSETNGLTHWGNEGRSFLKALSLTLRDHSSNREFADFHRHLLKEYSTGNYGPLPEFRNINFTQKFYLNPTRSTEDS